MPWKNILFALLGALLPILHLWIVKQFPDFPLPQDQFTLLIIWAVGFAVGGWNLKIIANRIANWRI